MLGYYKMVPGAVPPVRMTEGSVGYDLACVEPIAVGSEKSVFVRTGLVLKAPAGTWIMIALRSSLTKHGLILMNGVGVIDSDYCGKDDEVGFKLYNSGMNPIYLPAGSRIGQAILLPKLTPEVGEFEPSSSSRGGWGSTGS